GNGVPRPVVEPREVGIAVVRRPDSAIRGALQGVVMQQDRHVDRAELDVVLDHTEAMTGAFSEGGERVFGCQATGTPVGNQLRIWPFREWAGHGKRLRAMAAGGDRASF